MNEGGEGGVNRRRGLGRIGIEKSDCKVFDCISSKSEENWCFGVIVRYSTVYSLPKRDEMES
jgi:hypothetical protein